ncbi:MAG: TetR/AcrR family transcriptional regulator [Hydrogenovibrio sp.]|uniref:TetR/AcrR family transcriptional regulator n=1 Tax=Hydrogenovibrio sp. TaxID=2065821 RepID=UPI00286FB09B|nr:TetR/AcrR family transcriptional regulator [Hydrogenovibrio sp.]MDR9498730.1 TetR/AcrR family transcriptional regulator [Hydrogenovibrio sp.]
MMQKPVSATAQKILTCATEWFAAHGYEGAVMDDLAGHCGVNKASLYYHFQDKRTLYERCLTLLYQAVVDQVLAAVAARRTPKTRLSAYVSAFADAALGHPAMPTTLMREFASGGKGLPVTAREQMQRMLTCLKQILAEGRRQLGWRTTDPLVVHMMVVGALSFHVTSAPMRAAIRPDVSGGAKDPSHAAMVAEVKRLLLRALQA